MVAMLPCKNMIVSQPSGFKGALTWVGIVLAFSCFFSLASASAQPANSNWTTIAQGRFVPVEPKSTRGGTAGFSLLSPALTGILFTNSLAQERSITNHVLLNGSGVTAGDIDGDGWVDLYFCGLDNSNKLFRNLGNWRFEDMTDSAGVACADLDCTGAAFADLDGDGDLDLVVNSIAGGTRVFLNDGKGHFTPSARFPLLNGNHAGTSLALADLDGDGALDLYIANYRPMFFFLDKPETRYTFRVIDGQPKVIMLDGHPLTDPDFTNRFIFQTRLANGKVTVAKEELGEVDLLYRNDGHGGFTPISFTGGAFLDEEGRPLGEPPRDWGLSVMARDLNGDGFPDLYVCNDFRTPDRIWLNDGKGHFRAMPRLSIRSICLSAMGVDVADINRDGYFDIFVADMLATEHARRLSQMIDLRPESLPLGKIDNRPQFSRNTLQLARGDGTFAEIAQWAGLEASDWTWSPVFLDVDLDGFEDLLIANGFERDTMNVDVLKKIDQIKRDQKLSGREQLKLRKLFPRLDTPNAVFRNAGNCQFVDMSEAWGFNTAAVSQGMCLADLDNDGDLDVIVNNFNGPAGVYRNETTAPRVGVRLKGAAPNTRGIGAKIELLGGPVYQSQEMICGGRYCSSDDPMRTFAAGSATNQMKLVVTWRNGRKTVVEGVRANKIYEIDEMADRGEQAKHGERVENSSIRRSSTVDRQSSIAGPFFRDVSDKLKHLHHEEEFDDFERQPLLPKKLSQSGPGICWFDANGDGWEDIAIGSGTGGQVAIYQNDGRGGFRPLPATSNIEGPTTQVLGFPDQRAGLLIGASNYQDGQTTTASAKRLFLQPPGIEEAIPGASAATGPMALADLDGDGDLDLFVGGRVIPGRYPEAASSRIFLNDNGHFHLDQANTKLLEKAGLVSGAVFTDFNGDGSPDLALACEWGSLRLFRNDHGHLIEVTSQLGFDKFKGWWNGVTAGDFDGDGRMDLVSSNWGRNSRYEHFRAQPLRLFYGDFNGDGGVQTIEAYFDPQLKKIVPWLRLDEMSRAMPLLNEKFTTLQQFSRASMEEVLGDRFTTARNLEANWLESTMFLNRGDHFEARVLPFEAQLAPAFAVCVADFDGDGFEDIFMSQNFFAVPLDVSRYDAGRSLWLRGDGKGNFESMPGAESGLLVYGDQRGAAVCDYDADGRPDLAVSQNGAETKLFHNEKARPGLTIRLKGPPGNPQGIGALIRLGADKRLGPAREIHAGSGYLSQDSAVQVMSTAEGPNQLTIIWPGGKKTASAVPIGAREISVDINGNVQMNR